MTSLPVGYRIGDFEILECLPDGYRARDHDIGRDVRIHELFIDMPALRRFQVKVRALGELSHPNVGAVYDLVVHGERAFMVVEWVEGETLSARLARGPLPVDEAKSILAQVLEGVEAAHRRGLAHGELSASHVFVTDDGRAKVVGFGLVDETSFTADARAIDRIADELSVPRDARRLLTSVEHARPRSWTLTRVARWVFVVLALVLVLVAYVTFRQELSP